MYSSHGYDSEDEFIPKNVCLDIGEIPGDVDLSKTPSNGQEYLQQVVLEASQYRDVVVAKLDRSKLKKQVRNPNYGYWNFIPEAPPVSDELKPKKAWQSSQMANFLALKLKIESMKELLAEGKINRKELVELPRGPQESAWRKLIIKNNFVPSLKVMLSIEQFFKVMPGAGLQNIHDHAILHANVGSRVNFGGSVKIVEAPPR